MTEMISIRPVIDRDKNLIRSTWHKTNRRYCGMPSPINKALSADRYKELYKPVVNHLIDNAAVLVATDLTDNNPQTEILGWICTTPAKYSPENKPTLHYIWTKESVRGFGVARKLLEKAGLTGPFLYTFYAPLADKLWKKFPNAEYYPIAFWLGGAK